MVLPKPLPHLSPGKSNKLHEGRRRSGWVSAGVMDCTPTGEEMRRIVACLLTVLLGIAGCASYNPSSMPLPGIDSMAVVRAEGPVTIGLDPFVQGERQKKVFGGFLGEAGVIPVQILVENAGNGRVQVKSSDIVLVLPGGTRINQTGARAASAKMSSCAGMVAAAVGFGAVGAIVASSAEEKARAARLEDYQRKEFQDPVLGQGDSANGFLYFIPPAGSPDFSSAVLQVRVKNLEDATSSIVEMNLAGLNYKAPGREENENVQNGFSHQ